jgi:hypothetical protein
MLFLIWAWNEFPSDKTAPKEITLTSDETKTDESLGIPKILLPRRQKCLATEQG